jgi:hypothetical protein
MKAQEIKSISADSNGVVTIMSKNGTMLYKGQCGNFQEAQKEVSRLNRNWVRYLGGIA